MQTLAGTGLAARFRSWTGRSGRAYVFSVFRLAPGATGLDELPGGEAVVIGVERAADGSRSVCFVTETGGFPALVLGSRRVAELRSRGGELHLHLGAADGVERRRIAADLSAA